MTDQSSLLLNKKGSHLILKLILNLTSLLEFQTLESLYGLVWIFFFLLFSFYFHDASLYSKLQKERIKKTENPTNNILKLWKI